MPPATLPDPPLAAPTTPTRDPATMRTVVQRGYGAAREVLGVVERAVPTPGTGEIVVRVHAAPVQQGDWHLLTGSPHLVRAFFGLRRPRNEVPGQYAAGVVTAIGEGVTEHSVGDAVVGSASSSFAASVKGKANAFVPKPAALSFEEAAALPHGGFAALQALRDAGRLQPGQRVLVIGASGAVGLQAVQIAKAMGAHVTAVVGRGKEKFVGELGPDRVFAHTDVDFAREDERYDLVLDMIHDRPDAVYRRVLVPGGRCVIVGAGKGAWFGGMERVLWASLTSMFASKKLVGFLALPKAEDLAELVRLHGEGALRVPVDRSFALEDVAAAFEHLEKGVRGAVVVTPR